MFSDNKKPRNIPDMAAQPNRIGKGTRIKGDINSDADFRIDGTLEGNVKTSGKVVIGKEGAINGKVECVNADIEGLFEGELHVQELLTLKSSARIEGTVIVSKLAVEPGANFNATCSMKGSKPASGNPGKSPATSGEGPSSHPAPKKNEGARTL